MVAIDSILIEAIIAFILAIIAWWQRQQKTMSTANNIAIEEVKEKVNGTVQTTVITEPAPVVAGQWSDNAKKALSDALPVGSTITGTFDSPYAHVVYWTVKR